ncbi:LysR family transcriptional regulator [Comamonas serinivorans]|uniref:LysR family transcriptional regulator n=1 Tax=Comamonas serinivorans TaxID=1082851 RepID=A0A1Y0EPD3_9BURK|nr:LysR family transcriptional regulator [Comamonas serinivorans]ARU05142.1 LysR family transcriptional regulator [Comamonas serinivorans]
MRIDDLHALIALSQHPSLHATAHTLGVTQSALSKALARLEAQAGATLFERSSQGIAITAMGETLLRHARQVTQAMHDLETELGDERSAKAGLIRLAALPHLVPSFITPLLAEFHLKRPMARFSIRTMLSPQLLIHLEDGLVDLVIAAKPEASHPGLANASLGLLDVCMVARARHPRLTQLRSLGDLVHERWVLPDRGIYLRHWFEQLFARADLPLPPVAVESSHSQLAFTHLLRQSDLLGLVPRQHLSQPEGQGLAALPGVDMAAQYDLHVFWRAKGVLSPVAREFRDALLARGQDAPL